MSSLTFERLDPTNYNDRQIWRQVFRGAPSFVFATEGRTPTDADADRLMDVVPDERTSEDVFIHAVYKGASLVGCVYLARNYPSHGEVNLVLLLLIEGYQRGVLGIRCMRWIEQQALAWGCTRISGVADVPNNRASQFWHRLGFLEYRRLNLRGHVGETIIGHMPVSSENSAALAASAWLRRRRRRAVSAADSQ